MPMHLVCFSNQLQGSCADPPLDVPVAETIVHEGYAPQSNKQTDDIALIRLARPVQFTDWIRGKLIE